MSEFPCAECELNPGRATVGDFQFPCAVYSALWVAQQFNPDSSEFERLAVSFNPAVPGSLEYFCKCLQAEPLDFYSVLAGLSGFCGERGLVAPGFDTLNFLQVCGPSLPSPGELPLDCDAFTVVHYPGHWLVVGPELAPETEPFWAQFARRNGWFGALSQAKKE